MEETDNICFVCDKTIPSEKWKYKLQVTATKKRNVPVADLIKQLVGEEYAVLVGERDAVCSRCMNLLNLMDTLTVQLGEVQGTLTKLLHSKYDLSSESMKFQVQYDDSKLEDTEPLLKCENCSFQTKYEKEFNIHTRIHETEESLPNQVSTSEPLISEPKTKNVTKKVTKVNKGTPKVSFSAVSTRSSNTRTRKRKIPLKFREGFEILEKSLPKKTNKPKKKKVLFQCGVCEKIFPSETLIKDHAKKEHGKDKIMLSDDEYADIQTLESDEEVAVGNKTELKNKTKPKSKSEPEKKTVLKKEIEIKNKTEPKRKTKSKNIRQKKTKTLKLTKPKLDFLDDWEEDESNDLYSPSKRMKTEGSGNESETKLMNDDDTPQKRKSFEQDEEDDDKDSSAKPTCMFCRATFSSVESVQDHIKLSHRDHSSNLNVVSKNAPSPRSVASFEIDSTTDIAENKKQPTVGDNTNLSDHKSYKCNFCGIKKVSLQFIQQHIKVHKRKLYLQCKLCGTSFKSIVALKVHASKCHKAASIARKCNYCKFKFFDAIQLKNHMKNVHRKIVTNKENSNSQMTHVSKKPESGVENRDISNHVLSENSIKTISSAPDSSKISFSEVSSTSLEAELELTDVCYSCPLCEFKANTDLKIEEHAKKVHGLSEKEKEENMLKDSLRKPTSKTNLKCVECGISFQKPSRLSDHLNRHKASTCLNLGICVYCDKLFLDKEQVVIHTNSDHEQLKTNPKCNICQKTYSHMKDLKVHLLRSHFSETTEKLMKKLTEQNKIKSNSIANSDEATEVYNKVFKELQDLTGEGNESEDMSVDGSIQETPLNYCCPLCNFSSYAQDTIKSHLTTHTQNYCNICKNIFSPQESIKHIENHSIDFQDKRCSECDDKFHDDIHLQFHIQSVHPERKPHKCSMCVKSYFTEKSMLAHKETKHGKKSKKVFSCNKCKMDFYSEKQYQTHSEFAHRLSLNCKYCDKTFTDIKKLAFHERNHLKQVRSIYKCNICGKVLKSQSRLRTHKINHSSSKPLHCEVCNLYFKSFHTLREHSAKHSDTQEKKYFCDICGKGFYFYDSHYRHRRIHLDPLRFQCKMCKVRFQTNQLLEEHKKNCTAGRRCSSCLKSFNTISDLKKHECLSK